MLPSGKCSFFAALWRSYLYIYKLLTVFTICSVLQPQCCTAEYC